MQPAGQDRFSIADSEAAAACYKQCTCADLNLLLWVLQLLQKKVRPFASMHVAVLTGAGLTVEVPRALDINCCMNIPEPTLASARHHALLSAAAPTDPPCTSGRLAITHKTEPAQPKQACFGSKATRGSLSLQICLVDKANQWQK